MSEPKPSEQYHVSTDEVREAMEMLGAGYDRPSVVISPPHAVMERRGNEFKEVVTPAFVKISTGFKDELSNIDSNALKVWLYIALSINRNTEEAHPGIRTIAEGCGLDKDTISRAVKRLEELGLLTVERDKKKYNIYEIHDYVSVNAKRETVPTMGTTEKSVPIPSETVPIESESVPMIRGLNQINQSNQKKISQIRGIEGAILQGRPLNDEDLFPETKPLIAVIEKLASGFHYNFPKYGENKNLDRVARLIAKDGRSVEEFVAWAKANKRDPYWYHSRPDTLWGDWPQAFAAKEAEPSYYKRPAVLDEDESNYVIPD